MFKYTLIVIAGVLDFFTTFLGLKIGLSEVDNVFIPFWSNAIFILLLFCIEKAKVFNWLKKGLSYFVITFSYIPVINNFWLILCAL